MKYFLIYLLLIALNCTAHEVTFASASTSPNPTAKEPVTFMLSTDGPVRVLWVFNRRSQQFGQSVQFTYQKHGTYRVVAYVTEDDGGQYRIVLHVRVARAK